MSYPNAVPSLFPSIEFTTGFPDADAIKAGLRMAHEQGAPFDAPQVDTLLLGQPSVGYENEYAGSGKDAQLRAAYPQETIWASGHEGIWTPYNVVSALLTHPAVAPTSRDVLYDLGSGYGRIPLFAGIVSSAQCRGIELMPHRIHHAQEAAKRLEVPNVTFTQGNVREVDFSDGTLFYLYYPFSGSTFVEVVDSLKAIARQRQITILAKLCSVYFQDWAEPLDRVESRHSKSEGEVVIFRSR